MKKNFTLFIKLTLLIAVVFAFSQRVSSQLYINEFMASNDAALPGPDGGFPDWIEIYNAGDAPVMLGGYFMADDLNDPTAMYEILSTFPDSVTVAAGGFILFYANKKEDISVLNLNFKLSGGGEQIGLWAPDQSIIDTLTYGDQSTDTSSGRLPDGAETWQIFFPSSPGESNSNGIVLSVETYNALEKDAFQIYPNPVTGNEINFNKEVNIEVYSVTGKLILTRNKINRLEVSEFDSGIYMIKTDSGEIARMIIR